MPVFERSWQHRLVRGRNILPKIRDQGQTPGALESVYKKLFAERDQDFDKNVSVDALVSKFERTPKVKEILSLIQMEGALTDDNFERVGIEDFVSLDPQDIIGEFVQLLTHVLSCGTAIGIFQVFSSYNDATVYYQEVTEPITTDEEYEWDESDEDEDEDDDEDEDEGEDDNDDDDVEEEDELYEAEEKQENAEQEYHAVLLISLGMDDTNNLFWRVLDSHGTDAGEDGTRRIAVNLIKEAHILQPNA